MSVLPKPLSQLRPWPRHTGEETEAHEVKYPDLETPLVSDKRFDPDLPHALARPSALCCLEAGPWHLPWVTSQGGGWTVLSPLVMRWSCCLRLDAAAWTVLTALPVALFPSQCPGFPPAAWIAARLPTALH